VVDQRHVVPIARRPGGNAVAPLSSRSLDVEAWGPLGVELKLGRSAWPRGRPGERRRSPVCPKCSTSRPGERSAWSWNSDARRGPVVDQGNAVAPCLPGVSTSRPRDRSAWSWNSAARLGPVVDQGNAVARLSIRGARRRGLGTTRRGAEARPLDLARGRPGERGCFPVYPECSTSRPGDHSTGSWNSDARRGPVVDQRHVVPIARRPGGNAVAPCLPGVSTSRPGDHSAWS
jgi:hypothetical protein